ncbi:hypothetical protein R1flu_014321 [Riccia fluitans]|uniref:Uncharacterized protein n=1 Tax=Riccia fluitans TaxID=41844 RepID=A0ABD1YGG7_9MARC
MNERSQIRYAGCSALCLGGNSITRCAVPVNLLCEFGLKRSAERGGNVTTAEYRWRFCWKKKDIEDWASLQSLR